MSSDLCFWNRDEEGDQQSPHWRKKETIKESRFFHLYFVDSKGCLFFNLVPQFTTFLKEERAQYVFIQSFLMLLQREKSTKNKLLKMWQICSNNKKKKSGSKKLTSVTGVHKCFWVLAKMLKKSLRKGNVFIWAWGHPIFRILAYVVNSDVRGGVTRRPTAMSVKAFSLYHPQKCKRTLIRKQSRFCLSWLVRHLWIKHADISITKWSSVWN